jgi:heme/copper-type cytochrome/quinol oxidase subunit 2
MTHFRLISAVAALTLLLPLTAQAEEKAVAKDQAKEQFKESVATDVPTFEIVMKDHQFSPMELVVPADKDVKIIVKNKDKSPIEFESVHLNREKIIQPNAEVTLTFKPLKAGTYRYRDDFNEDAKGFITVK